MTRSIASGLVHVRTPTYRRPQELRRCLDSLRAQTWSNWICDVYDDDPDHAGEAVCRALDDPRIRYTANKRQLYASKNIDHCFTRANPHGAQYFCVLEDDNFLLDTFLAENIALCTRHGVDLVLRNQLVEHASGTSAARLGDTGVLDDLYREGLYDPATFSLSLLMGIGVSNGGLFWTSATRSRLEISYPCTATLQEYLRTFSIREPIYVAMTPLAVWADNAVHTTRNAGLASGYYRRELDLKKSVQRLRRQTWQESSATLRRDYLDTPRFAASGNVRAEGLVRSLIWHRAGAPLSIGRRLWCLWRGALVATLGRADPMLHEFIASRVGPPPSLGKAPIASEVVTGG